MVACRTTNATLRSRSGNFVTPSKVSADSVGQKPDHLVAMPSRPALSDLGAPNASPSRQYVLAGPTRAIVQGGTSLDQNGL